MKEIAIFVPCIPMHAHFYLLDSYAVHDRMNISNISVLNPKVINDDVERTELNR